MPLRKDIKKNTDILRTDKKDMSKAEVRKAKTDKAMGAKKTKEAGPVKKAVEGVKKTLPSKKVIEDKGEFVERQRGMAGGPKSREQYVAKKKEMGQKVKPRLEAKKGWGKNAPTKTRKMDE
jgi:hypothetical protein